MTLKYLFALFICLFSLFDGYVLARQVDLTQDSSHQVHKISARQIFDFPIFDSNGNLDADSFPPRNDLIVAAGMAETPAPVIIMRNFMNSGLRR